MSFYAKTWSQISEGGYPLSYFHKSKKIAEIPTIYFNAIDHNELIKEDNLNPNKKKIRFAISVPSNIDFSKNARIDTIENSVVMRLSLDLNNSLSSGLGFRKFLLAKDAKMFVYSNDYKDVIGAFTAQNNTRDSIFATIPLDGNSLTIEINEPLNSNLRSNFIIDEILHAYKDANSTSCTGFGCSESCEVNVNCIEAIKYQEIKKSVVRFISKDESGSYFCSGTLINNLKRDKTPYILTAEHNVINEETCQLPSVSYQSKYLFYFNYESPECTDPVSDFNLKNQSMTGCTVVSRSHDCGGNTGSDFCLLKLNVIVPSDYNASYAGWSRSLIVENTGVAIHHPAGDLKKISFFKNLESSSYTQITSDTHHKVYWYSTESGYGVTEGGSSGSAIFNSDFQILGTLTGGYASCSSKSSPDFFGKFSYHWASNGTEPDYRLESWLDPDNTLALAMNAMNSQGFELSDNDTTFHQPVIFPNACDGILNLTFINKPDVFQLKIYNYIGHWVDTRTVTEQYESIDLNNLINGVYILSFESREDKFVVKLVLQK